MKNIGRGVIFGERKKCDESSEVIYTTKLLNKQEK